MTATQAEELIKSLSDCQSALNLGLEAARKYPQPESAMFEGILVNIKNLNLIMARLVMAEMMSIKHINPAVMPHMPEGNA